MEHDRGANERGRVVAICVPTFRRPAGLRALLGSLEALRPARGVGRVEVVVVDNDPDGSAKATCDDWHGRTPTIRYVHEPRRGIPQARNAALRAAVGFADLVAFVDDDERADPRWLDELVRVLDETGADVAAGPVVTEFPAGAPRWLRNARFLQPEQRPDGAELSHCFTNNVLMRSAMLRSMDEWFDERLALTGGTDALLFRRVRRAGYRIVWAQNAVVRETMPESRATLRWVLQRALRIGATSAAINRSLHGPVIGGLKSLIVGAGRLVQGVLLCVPAMLLGVHRSVGQLRYAWYGMGLLAGLFGYRRHEYKQTHGS